MSYLPSWSLPPFLGFLALICVALAAPTPALAQASATDRATAEALFNDALELLQAKQPEAACPKLEESQRLDPGVGTLLYLADCYQQLGRTASAWATFRDAAYRANEQKDERESVAVELAAKLEPQLSYLVIRVPEGAPESLEIQHNGKTLGTALYGTEFPVDPGEHRVEAIAEGFLPWSDSLRVERTAGKYEVSVPALKPAPKAPPAVETPLRDVAPEPSHKVKHAGWYTPVGWALVGTGALGLVGGALLAAGAKQADQQADESCRPDVPALCNETGVDEANRAKGLANLSGVSAVIGLAALGTGVTLLWLRPSTAEQPAVGHTALKATLTGTRSSLVLESTW